jgi:hypothetical protein
MDWLLQNLVSAFLWEILLLVGVGTILGVLKAKWPNLAAKVLYGVIGATCVAVILFTFTGHSILAHQQSPTTPENIEANVRKWADSLGLGITRLPQSIPGQEIYFGVTVTLGNGNQLTVFRNKDKSGYLQIQCPLVLAPEHLAILNKLTKDEASSATQEVLLELARTKVGFQIMTASGQPIIPSGALTAQPIVLQQAIVLMEGVPIADLTEATFAQHIDEIDSAIALVRASTALTLQRYSREHDALNAKQVKQHS